MGTLGEKGLKCDAFIIQYPQKEYETENQIKNL